jgi:light-harvesting complex 1 alpha chain
MRPDRPIEFRTVLILYILLGIIVALTIHFIVLSSPAYNWLTG